MALGSLFGFFGKKELSAHDLGAGFITLVADQPVLEETRRSLKEQGIESNEHIETELMYVRAFAVVTALAEVLNYDERSDRANLAFFRFLGELHADSSKRSALSETFKAKIAEYAGAYGRSTSGGPLWNVGAQFSKSCGLEDAVLAVFGSMVFGATFKNAKDLIRRFRIT